MSGWAIFKTSIVQVFTNIKYALLVSWLPFSLAVVVVFLGAALSAMYPQLGVVVTIVSFMAIFTLIAWIAVGWHRFILIQEIPSVFTAKFGKERVGSYLWQIIKIMGPVVLVMILPLGGLVALGALEEYDNSSPWLELVLSIIPLLAIYFVLYMALRFSLILPAAALGHPMGLRTSWRKTAGIRWPLVLVVFLTGLFDKIIELPLEFLMGPLVAVVFVLTGWISVMINISIITTIYEAIEENEK